MHACDFQSLAKKGNPYNLHSNTHYLQKFPFLYPWVSRDVIISLGGQLQIDAQSSEGNSFSLYVLNLCLAANMCNFARFFHSSTA